MLSILMSLAAAGALQSQQLPERRFTCPDLPGSAELLPTAGPPAEWPIVVMGEVHGTVETPAMFGDLVCRAAMFGPVNVHLEWATSLQSQLDAYLASDGSDDARAKLYDHWQFRLKLPDGRTSEAMLTLLERIRKLRGQGADIRVFCSQPDFAIRQNGKSQFYYELAMANAWATPPSDRLDARNLVLVGNFHAARRDFRNTGAPPAASYLRSGDAILLNPLYQGGQSWTVEKGDDGELSSGAHAIGFDIAPGEGPAPRGISLKPTKHGAYDGTYSVGGPFTASPPAHPRNAKRPPG
ncbi:MAG: hypothetical protein J7496_08275 [Novosphingobium sp.]|nr:hypothetical protein [Novosphingobium sp.]